MMHEFACLLMSFLFVLIFCLFCLPCLLSFLFFSFIVYLLSFNITPTVLPSGHVSCISRVTCTAGIDLHKPQPHAHTYIDRNRRALNIQVKDDLFTWVGIWGWKMFCWLSTLIEMVVVVMELVPRRWLGVLILGLVAPGWLAADLESVSLPKARIAFSVLRNVRRGKKHGQWFIFCLLLQLALCLPCGSLSCLSEHQAQDAVKGPFSKKAFSIPRTESMNNRSIICRKSGLTCTESPVWMGMFQ